MKVNVAFSSRPAFSSSSSWLILRNSSSSIADFGVGSAVRVVVSNFLTWSSTRFFGGAKTSVASEPIDAAINCLTSSSSSC